MAAGATSSEGCSGAGAPGALLELQSYTLGPTR